VSESVLLRGWWSVSFDLHLEGEDVRFEDISEVSQEHIINCIKEGYTQGELIEDPCGVCTEEDCDTCPNN